MKITDYCPRAAPFDSYLKGRGLVGVEIGVDVGAHAEAMLRHADIAMLHLVDPWPNPYCRGYCEGRMAALGYRMRTTLVVGGSLDIARQFPRETLDFVYIDQEHDGQSVGADLAAWWPIVKLGGVLGYRNYTETPSPLKKSVDAFVTHNAIRAKVETGEIVLVKA